jgi:uncharacterized protein YkwD
MRHFLFTIPKLGFSYKKMHKIMANTPLLCNICLGLLMTTMIALYAHTSYNTPRVLGVALNLESIQIVELVNEQRSLHNIPPLELNPLLNQAALDKANDMITNNYWDHYAPNSQTPWQFISRSGYVYKFAGENLAKDYYKEEDIVSAWLQSAGHRANMLSEKFSQTGIATIRGTINGEESILVVQLYATPFSREELALIQAQGAVIVNQTTQINPPVTSSNKGSIFMSTKILFGFVIFVIMVTLSIDIRKHIHKARSLQIIKRYWLNIILLFTTCTIYSLTLLFSAYL